MTDLLIMKKLVEDIEKGKEIALASIVRAQGSAPRGVGTKMLVYKDGSIYGTIGGGALEKRVIDLSIEAIRSGKSHSIEFPLSSKGVEMVCGGHVDIFIDVFKSRPKLLIVGGGHVGEAMYKLASLLNFSISIFEDREEFLSASRFPLADELISGDMEKSLRDYPIDRNCYILIASRGHAHDERALEAVANSKAAYIGVLGSKKKVKAMMDSLKGKGLSQEVLDRVYAPVGLKISGESPGEIALSIMAEIELVRNKGQLIHMRDDK